MLSRDVGVGPALVEHTHHSVVLRLDRCNEGIHHTGCRRCTCLEKHLCDLLVILRVRGLCNNDQGCLPLVVNLIAHLRLFPQETEEDPRVLNVSYRLENRRWSLLVLLVPWDWIGVSVSIELHQ